MKLSKSSGIYKAHFLISFVLAPILLGLSSGDLAPNFSAKNQDGKTIRMSDFKGEFVLIYFYPKDDTPGCTKEACQFRDEYKELRKHNTAILGVSRQGEKSHQKFKTKHKLPFDLLADEDGTLAKAFDIKSMPLIGLTKRQSVLIGPDGKILQYYRDVDPSRHAKQVLEDIQRVQPAS